MSCRGVRPTTGTAGWKLGHEPRLLVWEWWGNGGLGAPATETLAGDLDENGARDRRDAVADTPIQRRARAPVFTRDRDSG